MLMSLNTQAYTRLDRVYDQVFDLTYATGITLLKWNFVVLNLSGLPQTENGKRKARANE